MEPTPAQRKELGERIKKRRPRLFGTKKGAYMAADVNSATWNSAEAGERLRPDRLAAIVKVLWPETEGDWELLVPPLGQASDSDIADQIRNNALFTEAQKDYMLRLIAEDRERHEQSKQKRERGAS